MYLANLSPCGNARMRRTLSGTQWALANGGVSLAETSRRSSMASRRAQRTRKAKSRPQHDRPNARRRDSRLLEEQRNETGRKGASEGERVRGTRGNRGTGKPPPVRWQPYPTFQGPGADASGSAHPGRPRCRLPDGLGATQGAWVHPLLPDDGARSIRPRPPRAPR